MKADCYCNPKGEHPKSLEREGIPSGYCGICERCGKPGHTRHFPGPVPCTGSWCDRCYRLLPWITPALWIPRIAIVVLLVTLGWLLWRVIIR